MYRCKLHRQRGELSLVDVFRSIHVSRSGFTWRRALAFIGPGYLVSVGYMDPALLDVYAPMAFAQPAQKGIINRRSELKTG